MILCCLPNGTQSPKGLTKRKTQSLAQLLSQRHGGRSLASDAAIVFNGLYLVGMPLVKVAANGCVMVCAVGPFMI